MKFFFFNEYKIKILLNHNLNVYICETFSQRLEPRPLPPHSTNTYTCKMTTIPKVCRNESCQFLNILGIVKLLKIFTQLSYPLWCKSFLK